MQRASNRWRKYLTLTAVAFLGCATGDASSLVDPVKGGAATKAMYAYTTPYGEIWEVDGELHPAGYGNPWDAVISSASSWTEWPSTCTDWCTVEFDAHMTGLWQYTRQDIQWEVAGMSGTAQRNGYTWSCLARLSPTHCLIAERTDSHTVFSIPDCSWTAKVQTDHSAWWGSWFDISLWQLKVGIVGRVEASSKGLDVSHDHCNPILPSSGGGSGSQICYDYYLVWTDWQGYHEEYVGTQCFVAAE